MAGDFAGVYRDVVGLLLSGNADEARSCLLAVPGRPEVFSRAQGRGVSRPVQFSVFRRDGFSCRYCGRRVVLPPVLRLLSIPFGEVFPYHRNGRMDVCHLAFWRDYASCDHVIPAARGGTSDMENLVTACYMCNSIKQNWRVEELRWEMQPIPGDSTWDGLSAQYPRLLSLVREGHPDAAGAAYFTDWLRVVGAGSSDDSLAD